MRLITLAISAIMGCAVLAQSSSPQITIPRKGADVLMLCALSDNGLYAASVNPGDETADNPRPAGGVLYEVATGNTIDIPAPGGWSSVADIADNGLCVGQSAGMPASFDPATGQWTSYAVPAGWDGGQFIAVTPDGRYGVGVLLDANDDYHAAPMMYDLTTGQNMPLANMPAVDLNGDPVTQNVAYGISPDGRYLVGHVSESFMMPVAMFAYVYDTVEHTWTPIGYNYNAATQQYACTYPNLHFIDTRFASCDGTWVCGTAYMVVDDGELSGGSEYYAPYRYNVANGQLEVYAGADDQNIQGDKITADGTLLGSTPAGYLYPTAVVRHGQFFISLDQILQTYGINLQAIYPNATSGSFQCLSADGLTAIMRTYDDCYILRMPEPFSEAAARVNLLGHYTASIPSGSTISRIGEIKVTFDRAIGALNLPSQVQLRKADGTAVRSASAFAVSSANDHVLVITFRTTNLDQGCEYYIDIPAEMVWLKDDPAIKSQEIKLHYYGRGDAAVQPLEIVPAEGSALASINPADRPVIVAFDSYIAISDDAQAALYNDDDNTLVTPLYGSSQANILTLYPLTEYHLYKGTRYRVEISAGTVTDLSGVGPCQPITIHYDGAYVRELSADDIYVFNADCNTYEKFIYWQTEFNEPSDIPASWGFTAETPWLLVRDNEETADQALAAHSMFTTAGTSDDWLITPQLYIPDAATYLAFDAQRYLQSKADVLQVRVLESDAVYNYWSDDLCAEARQDGDLIFDQEIPAGATDEGLEGEWTHYTCDLSRYAGKNIYIAFVNNNADQSAVFLDNVQVVRNMDFMLTNRTPLSVVDKDEVTVGGIVSVVSEMASFAGIELTLRDSDGVIATISDPDVTLAYGDTYDFTFTSPLPLTPGEETSYTIDISSGESLASYPYAVKDLLFEPRKRVVLEEYSGATCGNCPLGIRAAEELEATYPDNFIPVILRTYGNDIYASGITGYSSFLGCEQVGAPSGRINRGPTLFPAVSTPDGYRFVGEGITQSDGSQACLWADAVRQELATPAEAEVEFEVSGWLTVDCTVRFALNTQGRSLGLFAVVTEDDLYTIQLNYMNTLTDPALGQWGANGMYNTSTVTTWRIDDVARYVISGNAYNGTPIQQSSFLAGQPYTMTLTAEPSSEQFVNSANCHVVVMLIDTATGRVINANRARLGSSDIPALDTESLSVEYYNLQGMPVAHPEPGNIYIRRQGSATSKILYK